MNLAQDTIYAHPSNKVCNYSVGTSSFVKRSELDSYVPKIAANVRRDSSGAVVYQSIVSNTVTMSFSGKGPQQASVPLTLTNGIPLYFASAQLTYSSEEHNGSTGGSTALYVNGAETTTTWLVNNTVPLYLNGIINPSFNAVFTYTANSIYNSITYHDVVLTIYCNDF